MLNKISNSVPILGGKQPQPWLAFASHLVQIMCHMSQKKWASGKKQPFKTHQTLWPLHTQAKGHNHVNCEGPWFSSKGRTTDTCRGPNTNPAVCHIGTNVNFSSTILSFGSASACALFHPRCRSVPHSTWHKSNLDEEISSTCRSPAFPRFMQGACYQLIKDKQL